MNIALLDTVGGLFKDLFGIAGKFVEDKDKRNELNTKLFELQTQTTNAIIEAEREKSRLEAEIAKAAITSDLPKWARIIYLFGRQAYSMIIVVIISAFQFSGNPLDPNTILMMVAPGTVYSAVKGAGTRL